MSRRLARATQADVARAIAAVQQKGLKPNRIEIDADGKIVVFLGEQAPTPTDAADAALERWKARKHARAA